MTCAKEETPARKGIAGRATTSAAVGIVATLVDWVVLVAAVRGMGIAERWAIVPAFFAGVIVQFFGNRRFAFRAQSDKPALRRQALRFTLVEMGTLALSALLYNVLRELLGIDYRLARVVTGLAVYFGFSLPLWHWVFAIEPSKQSP